MGIRLLALFLLALAVAYAFLRFRAKRTVDTVNRGPQQGDRTLPPSAFHAVSIQPGTEACRAAKALREKRFLSGDAPALPLDDCTLKTCQCRFEHHADRRRPDERRSPMPSGFGDVDSTGKYRAERRGGKDRRAGNEDL